MSDLDELTSLNRDYVASVQNCDVKRFDEILAADFYCSNPDKSLVDRAGFLKQTAVPVADQESQGRMTSRFASSATSPSSMPAPAIRLPDGKQAAGRYTDCWARAERALARGVGACVAVTHRRRPARSLRGDP